MNYQDVQTILWECLVEEYLVGQDDALIQRLNWQVMEQRLNTRLYYLNEVSARQLWKSLREDEGVLHLIMQLTIAFKLRLGLDHGPNAFSELCELMDRSLNNLAEEKIADPVFCEQLPNGSRSNKVTSILINNPWLVMLILIERNAAHLTQRGFFPTPKLSGE